MKIILFVISLICCFHNGDGYSGHGFSTDSQQVAPKKCFKTVISSTTERTGSLDVDTQLSFKDFQKELRIDVDIKGNFWMFSGEAEASYLRKIEDKIYSFALHYYQYESAKAVLQFDGGSMGLDALTEIGKEQYNKGFQYFGLECGNRFITDYKFGAQLISSLRLEFSSHEELKKFKGYLGSSLGSITSAAGKIQSTSKHYNMDGTFAIKVLQRGGDPSQLPKIFKKDPSGKYVFLQCDLKNMDECVKAAGSLLDYAKNDFSTQVDFKNGTGLTPLGPGFIHSKYIREINLKEPPSFVNDTVKSDRLFLANEYKKNQYYQEYSHDLLEGYPINWNVNSDIYKQIKNLNDYAVHNQDIIASSEEGQGAQECFNSPYICHEVMKSIKKKQKPLDLGFLPFTNYIIVMYTVRNENSLMKTDKNENCDENGGVWYWYVSSDKEKEDQYRAIHPESEPNSIGTIQYNGNEMVMKVYISVQCIWHHYNGTLNGNYPDYSGVLVSGHYYSTDASSKVKRSEFFFKKYNETL